MSQQFFKSIYKGNTKWFLFVITFLLAVIGYTLGQIPFMAYLSSRALQLKGNVDEANEMILDFSKTSDLSPFQIQENNLFVSIQLLMFVGCLLGLWIGVKFLHKLSLKSLVTPFKDVKWNKIFFSFGLWFLIMALFQLADVVIDPENYVWQFDPKKFVILLLISSTLLFLQTSTEELLFRGYLLQAFGLMFKNKWVPYIITSLLFGAIHFANPETTEYGIANVALHYIVPGLLLGLITIMDDSLELALGMHWANNFVAATLVTFNESALQTDALYSMKEMEFTPIPWGFIIGGAIYIFICYKKYKWRSFTYLFENINYEHAKNSNPEDFA